MVDFWEIALKKDRITVALLWPKYDGGITSINDLVLGLDKERFKVLFIYLSGYGIGKNLIEEAGYEVFYLSNIELLKAFRFSIWFKLVGILKEHKVDIIHCHGHKPTVYGTIATTLAKTPVVIAHVHGLGRTGNFIRRLTNFFLFKKIDGLVPVAQAVKEDILKNNWLVPAEKLSVLENSIDYQKFAEVSITQKDAKQMLGLPLDAFVFGTVGRLAPTKGISHLIEAFAKVKGQMSLAHLVLVGGGRCRAEYERQAVQVGCDGAIHFLGRRDSVAQLLRAMDVFVLASVAEGMPRALLEAMAAGVPCIGTNVGGIPEILGDNEFSCLVEPGDSTAFAKAMLNVGNMPAEELEKNIAKARDRVRQRYSHDVAREKLRELYESEFRKRREIC